MCVSICKRINKNRIERERVKIGISRFKQVATVLNLVSLYEIYIYNACSLLVHLFVFFSSHHYFRSTRANDSISHSNRVRFIKMNDLEKFGILDEKTPPGAPLSAKYKR